MLSWRDGYYWNRKKGANRARRPEELAEIPEEILANTKWVMAMAHGLRTGSTPSFSSNLAKTGRNEYG
jgi:hypothetical protein